MNESFDRLHRTLGRTTVGVLFAVLAFYGIAMAFALLGISHVAESLNQAGLASAIIFGALFVVFVVSSLVAAILRWLERHDRPIG